MVEKKIEELLSDYEINRSEIVLLLFKKDKIKVNFMK